MMKSQQIEAGDKLEGHYTVLDVQVGESRVTATVEYPGGN